MRAEAAEAPIIFFFGLPPEQFFYFTLALPPCHAEVGARKWREALMSPQRREA